MVTMTTYTQQSDASDAELVARCVKGDRQAYTAVVERHQSVICALTYANCGDVHQSEDLAQETFLAAWKQLPDLKDPSRLRAWLCGIARNLINSARRKQGRAPVMLAPPDDDTLNAQSPTPPEEAISQEEQTLLWQNLARLPEEYREPMVLYYRQQESVAAVAAALDISEDAARQRLSRGRAMLAQRIEHLIDRGLRKTGPTKAFTLAVVAAMPGAVFSAKAAAMGTAVAKGGASAKAASTGFIASSILGPLIGLASFYLGYRVGLEQTIALEERRFVRGFFWRILLLATGANLIFLGGIYGTRWLGLRPVVAAGFTIAVAIAYSLSLVFYCFWYQRRIRQLRAELTANQPEMQEKARQMSKRWNMQYRSRWKLLGLPLLDINIGGTPDARPAVAKGWIAIGAKAYGVLAAFGAIAVAPISLGGLAVGLLTWGGFAVGVIVWGGFALGIWTVGGFAAGWKVVGGCAVGLSAALGPVAVAKDYALGLIAVARHANGPTAEAFFSADRFYRICDAARHYVNWVWLVALVPVIPMVRRAIQIRRNARSDQGK